MKSKLKSNNGQEGWVKNFTNYVKSLKLDFNQHTSEFNYSNPVLILIDAVLSMNRKYDSFVVPRIEIIKKSGIKTLEGALQTIEKEGVSGFCKIWNYNHPERVEILKRLINKYLLVKKELKIDDDLTALKEWGRKSTVENYEDFNVKGIGFVTYQYLRLMCGADTTKPDIHLKRAVKEGTGQSLSEAETVQVVELTAKEIKVKARQLDYALWRYYSKRNKI
jgi:hypothetical protein